MGEPCDWIQGGRVFCLLDMCHQVIAAQGCTTAPCRCRKSLSRLIHADLMGSGDSCRFKVLPNGHGELDGAEEGTKEKQN